MLTLQNLLGKAKLEDQSPEIQACLKEVLEKVNKVLAKCPIQNWIVTSGLRTMEDHLRIYREKAAKAGIPFDESKVPKKSKHLFGQAVDIYDPGLKITAWLKANPQVLEEANLYCEEGNSNWVHYQIRPFGSYKPGGTRWFIP